MVLELGQVYGIRPTPLDPERTTFIPAGVVTFGIEPRLLAVNTEYIDGRLKGSGHSEETSRRSDPHFVTEGPSIHVLGSDNRHEYLRIDLFDERPHYHYLSQESDTAGYTNRVVMLDAATVAEPLGWALGTLRSRLGAMLTQAGGAVLAEQLDSVAIAAALDRVEELVLDPDLLQTATKGRS